MEKILLLFVIHKSFSLQHLLHLWQACSITVSIPFPKIPLLLISLFSVFETYVGHIHRVGQHLLQSADRQGLLQNEVTYGQVWGYTLQIYKQHTGKIQLIKTRFRTYSTGQKDWRTYQELTWALDVVSRKQRRFPNPSQDRHSLICSFRTEAVHCRTTWSSCTQNTIKHSFTLLSCWHTLT